MSTEQTIADTLAEAGARDEAIVAVIQRDAAEWVVRYEDLDIEVGFSRETGRIAWHCELGIVRAERRPAAYETFLRYNFLFRDTGGVLLALNENVAVLMLELAIEAGTPDVLAAVLGNFTAKARIWARVVAEGVPAPADAHESVAFGIRV